MREFFYGWRRKAGCVTLAIALAVYCAWMRSRVTHDLVALPWGNDIYCIESMWGQFDLGRVTLFNNNDNNNRRRAFWKSDAITRENWQWIGDDGDPRAVDYLSEVDEIEWRWDWAGFHFGAGHSSQQRTEDYLMPYWCLAVPLTLLSAYLILAKPRKRPTQVMCSVSSETTGGRV